MKKFLAKILYKLKYPSRRLKITGVVLLILLVWFWLALPKKLFDAPTSYIIEDRGGNLLNASIAADGQWRFPENETIPGKFIDCITTFEDKRFFYHPGVDPAAIFRAVSKNIKNKRSVQGGSTISMQVIRLSLQNNRRSIWNKLKESILAIRLECSYSKKEIMALYAGNAPFGSNVVGLEAAAWRYYGRSPDKLSWGETAALAVLPNAPALVHPGKNANTLLKKRNNLLDKLLEAGKIDSSTCELSKMEPLPGKPLPLPQLARHLFQRFKKENPSGAVTRIRSTLDAVMQKNVTAILQQHHAVLKGNGINNACALVLDVETGNVLSYVGNINAPGDKEMEADVDIISSFRSPGSALKPLLYAASLSDGIILPKTLLPDIPMQIGNYTPKNFDLTYDGAVAADMALARSLNIPAVKLLQQYKYQRFYETLKQCGISTLNRPANSYGLSLILGGCEVSPWDLAGMYASMARALNHQNTNNGNIDPKDFHPPTYKLNPAPVYRQAAAIPLDLPSVWFTFQAMKEVMRPGEEGLWQQFNSSQTIAWKTGTSFGFRDGWAIGITAKYVVCVWTGNADGEGRPNLVGIQTAAPVLFDIFRLLPATPWFQQPAQNFSFVPVCPQTGFRVNIDCGEADSVYAPPNAIRSALCPYHKKINLDASGTWRVTEDCENPSSMQHVSWFVLTPAIEYYYRQSNAAYKSLPAFKEGCSFAEPGKPIEIIYPLADAKIYVPLEITGEKGRTIFTAAHRRLGSKIFWSLDDEFITSTQNFHQVSLSPAPGKHLLTLVDESGYSVSREFEILEKE
ncbi:MAG: penicillin-binding protein 1C [Ferruginibacter sp.]